MGEKTLMKPPSIDAHTHTTSKTGSDFIHGAAATVHQVCLRNHLANVVNSPALKDDGTNTRNWAL